MKEYIERAHLLKNLGYDDCDELVARRCRDALSAVPAADVAEVRHGRLNFLQEDMVWCYCGVCSVCGNYVQAWNYCPNCGTRMDKENKHKVRCANCGQIKDILCTINGEPCCEDCFNNVLLQGMYDNFKEEIMKKETPKICEVIGVKVNQIFKFSDLIFDDPKEYFINENGEIKSVNGEEVTCKEVCRIVNNHDYITRCDELLFTDQERNLMKLFQDACVDTVYIKREKYGGLSWYSSNSTNLENHLLPFRLFKTLPNNTTICVKDYI